MQATALVHQYLEQSAARYPAKTAVVHDDVRATYAQIEHQANELAWFLTDNRVSVGDRVILLSGNCIEYVIGYYAALKAGAVVVPFSTDIKPDSFTALYEELAPKAIITSFRFERLLKAARIDALQPELLIVKAPKANFGNQHAWDDVVTEGRPQGPSPALSPDALASIIYTSGSTGNPKGVMLTHGNITANTASICQYLALTADDIQMVVLPFFYVMGKSLLNTHMAVGGTVVLNNKFAFPAGVLNQMVAEQVTGFSGVPSTYAHLLHRSPLRKMRDQFETLRYCSQAGGHMSRQLKQELARTLPAHTDLIIMYGATEASARLTYLHPDDFDAKMTSIGKPIPGVTLRVLDSRGNVVAQGEKGELVASGANIMQGYWQAPGATRTVLDANGYHTGDMGYQDADGFFFVNGRKDNLVKVGGHRINPQEVEDAIDGTGLSVEAAVIGVPDPLLGNKLVGLVVAKETQASPTLLMQRLADKLPKYKLPAEIRFARTLPKKANSKVDRFKCAAIIAEKK